MKQLAMAILVTVLAVSMARADDAPPKDCAAQRCNRAV